MYIIDMLDFHLFGFNPMGFHLVNVLFHAAVSVLVFVIALKLFGEEFGASSSPPWHSRLLRCDTFSNHPVHTEAVTWVAACRASLQLFFVFFL